MPYVEKEKKVSRISVCFNGILSIKVNQVFYYLQYQLEEKIFYIK